MKAQKLTFMAVLVAITVIFALTPLGYLTVPPIIISFMCIPVVVGTLLLGLRFGLFLGLLFGASSFFLALTSDVLGQFLLGVNVPLTIAVIFLPRLLIPVSVHYVSKVRLFESKRYLDYAVSAFAGSLTNTVGFLGLLYGLFGSSLIGSGLFGPLPEGVLGVIAGVGIANGLPEAGAALLLCPPIVMALKKIVKMKKV